MKKTENHNIKTKLKLIPQKPGVYLLKDVQGKILYVGKAKALRNRLRSHFKSGKEEEPRHHALMKRVTDFEIIVTDTEVEALILEANFVKEHKPRYNVNLKDDKSYPYVRVTHEPYPRIFVTRKIRRDGSRYFGPYTDVGSLRQLMSAVRRIFPVRTCHLHITQKSIEMKKNKVCLNYHIGRCQGPCEGLISMEEYQWTVHQVITFIQGKNDQLLKDLENRMQLLAQKQRYEEAALLRNEIRAIDIFQSKQKVVDEAFKDRDLLTIAVKGKVGCGVAFHIRDGKITNRQHLYLNTQENISKEEVLTAFVKYYYLHAEFIPPEIVIPYPVMEKNTIKDWLIQKRGKKVELNIPQRGKKNNLLKMCTRNAELLLNELVLQKEQLKEKSASTVEALQKDLHLSRPPKRIEAFDISNIQGVDSVASLVVFVNGKPLKSDYRHYKIKTVKGPDDYASMAEVVERRMTRLLNEDNPLPDLIFVDGGKGQLSAALSVLEKLGVEDVPLIGLAKKLEDIYLPGFSEPQNIPKHSPSLYLLQRIRDEAHRFAVTFHRQLRKKRIIQSELDVIPGVGESRRKALLNAFGSVDKIRSATVNEIAKVQNINFKLAEKILQVLKENDG